MGPSSTPFEPAPPSTSFGFSSYRSPFEPLEPQSFAYGENDVFGRVNSLEELFALNAPSDRISQCLHRRPFASSSGVFALLRRSSARESEQMFDMSAWDSPAVGDVPTSQLLFGGGERVDAGALSTLPTPSPPSPSPLRVSARSDTGDPAYAPTNGVDSFLGAVRYHSITAMPAYANKSVEELRAEDYRKGANSDARRHMLQASSNPAQEHSSSILNPVTTSASLFGHLSPRSQASRPPFGQLSPQSQASRPPFGFSSASSSAGLFGSTTAVATESSASESLFGVSSSSSPAAPSPPPPCSLFGDTQQKQQLDFAFGYSPSPGGTQSTATTTPELFGGSSPSFSFGYTPAPASTAPASTAPVFSFGSTTPPASALPAFCLGPPAATSISGLFGSAPAPTPSFAPFGFGQMTSTGQVGSVSSSPSFSFGYVPAAEASSDHSGPESECAALGGSKETQGGSV